ncbi:MAG: DUF2185 domain-containing protein [Lachnospiraceae bacterium]|nr:DUF2185 domain-containing protein [Lachnospiraceae bacterium]
MGLFDKFKKKTKTETEAVPLYLYSEQELDEYEAFVQKNFGQYNQVMHEIVSPDIHLDIIMVPPTDENPFYKMVTMGMGAFKMNVPEELKEYELEYAELVLYLPPDWKVNSSEERDYWPLRYMKVLGRLPVNADTWLGFGHTVHGDEERRPFADNTKFNNILLLNACNLELQSLELRLSSGKKINFYHMFPLYQEELDYKLANSLDDLLELFDDADLFPVLNIRRKNYALGRGNGCIVSNRIVKENWNIGYLYRDEPMQGVPDSGWRFLKGDEDETYMSEAGNHSICALTELCKDDPDLKSLLDAPIGTCYIRVGEHTFIEDDGQHEIFMSRRVTM